MRMTTRTAFLMPLYNPDPKALRRTLESLRAQTVSADIVVVDDGSHPPVEGLCGGTDVTVIRLDRNEGIVGALNRGLVHIVEKKYDYIARMDCGDTCLPERIAAQQAFMDRELDVDLLGALATIVDEDNRYLFTEGTPGDAEAVQQKLWDNAAFKHPTFFLRARSLAQLGLYSRHYPHAEDYEFARRYAKYGVIACLDTVLIVYEKTTSGLSIRNRGAQLRSRLRAQLRYLDWRRMAAFLGVCRTLATMVMPASVWARASKLYWQRMEKGRHPCRTDGGL
ncbi:hypothetical protein AFCDBAGC_4840 [Methylobacterium cerastii]|uniref:Glycosyltransferase 2-like domain-containing protein n=2 Tax=Methylobacterium cerastii TaxID=932741 RepID=A0ABQ4QPZ2_9HYPH|nr:hypothetical protein AFCDBAGC_4840 [Methylobacterium cerastii]